MTSDGGPAFPLTEDAVNFRNRDFAMQGMSLRDWFAGMAASGMMANPHLFGNPETVATDAYHLAEAMLKERERRV